MIRDKTPYSKEEQIIIHDVGIRYRKYLKYKGFDYESYGRLINLEESSCKDYMYFPNTLKTISLHEMAAEGISMDWLMGFTEKMFREHPDDSSEYDWQVIFKNIVYNIDRTKPSRERYLMAIQLLPVIAGWLEPSQDGQRR